MGWGGGGGRRGEAGISVISLTFRPNAHLSLNFRDLGSQLRF